MQKITATVNSTRTGFSFPSDYNKATLLEWMKKYRLFEIKPVIKESIQVRGYLEGGIIPAYCEWQYGIDPRERGRSEQRRFLFKRDFNYEVVNNRDGDPVRSPVSSKGIASQIVTKYTEWASENGAPIPNPDLYKLWRDKYAIDDRFPTFFDFLSFLRIECDAMPSSEFMEKLKVETPTVDYPDGPEGPVKF